MDRCPQPQGSHCTFRVVRTPRCFDPRWIFPDAVSHREKVTFGTSFDKNGDFSYTPDISVNAAHDADGSLLGWTKHKQQANTTLDEATSREDKQQLADHHFHVPAKCLEASLAGAASDILMREHGREGAARIPHTHRGRSKQLRIVYKPQFAPRQVSVTDGGCVFLCDLTQGDRSTLTFSFRLLTTWRA